MELNTSFWYLSVSSPTDGNINATIGLEEAAAEENVLWLLFRIIPTICGGEDLTFEGVAVSRSGQPFDLVG